MLCSASPIIQLFKFRNKSDILNNKNFSKYGIVIQYTIIDNVVIQYNTIYIVQFIDSDSVTWRKSQNKNTTTQAEGCQKSTFFHALDQKGIVSTHKEEKLKAYSSKIKPSWYEKYSCCTSKFKIFLYSLL